MSNVLKAKINGQWTEISAGGGSSIEIPSTTNLLKGDGSGGVSTATAGTDYQAPLVAGKDYQVPLVSGTNIKTINNESILGNGNITIGASEPKLKYSDSIDKPFDFNGKTIQFYGDSITAGVISGTHESTDKGYAALFCEKVGATIRNSAISGSTTVQTSETVLMSVYDVIDGASSITADYIIIAGGTNDYYYQIPLGTYNSSTPTEFYGGLNGICEMLKTKAPNIKVIFITPINKPTKPTATTKLYDLDDYRNAIFEVATTYAHSVVDGTSLGFPDKHGANLNTFSYKMIWDGVHPTVDGHRMYANSLCGKLL